MRAWGPAFLSIFSWLLVAGCTSGERLVLTDPNDTAGGFESDAFLPQVNTVDSGPLTLANGEFDGGGDNLVFSEPFSTSSVTIADNAVFSGPDSIFDTDDDGDYDSIILTLRTLSAQSRASVAANGGTMLTGRLFYKLGGIAILPPETDISTPVTATVPVSSAGTPTAGEVYELYRWNGVYQGFATPFSGSAGRWEFVQTVTVDSSGNTVTFDVDRLGEYAVVDDSVTIAAAS